MIENVTCSMKIKKKNLLSVIKKILILVLSTLILQPMVMSNTSATTALTGRTGFLWGMNVHNKGYAVYPESKLEEHVRLTAELGSKIMRFNFNPRNLNDYRYLDSAVQLCKDYGLEMMLVLDAFSIYNTQQEFENYHSVIAKRYKGKIKYYQLFNELDVYCMYLDNGNIFNGGDGSTINQYNPARLEEVTPKLLGSIKAFRTNDPDANLVVNFAYKHTAILDYFMDSGAEWDIIGHDWYSDMEAGSSVTGVFDKLIQKHPTYDIMICETNIWAHTQYTEDQQSDFIARFIKTVYDYGSPKIIGMIFYELLDEPQFQTTSTYSGEAHFGFVKCDITGNNLVKKKAFTTIQNMIGGKPVPLIIRTVSSVAIPTAGQNITSSSSKNVITSSNANISVTSSMENSSTEVISFDSSQEPSLDTNQSSETFSSSSIKSIDQKDGSILMPVIIVISSLLLAAGVFLILKLKILNKKI